MPGAMRSRKFLSWSETGSELCFLKKKIFFNVLLFIFETERDRARAGKGQREEGDNRI